MLTSAKQLFATLFQKRWRSAGASRASYAKADYLMLFERGLGSAAGVGD
jgi:hypothetical protein